MSVHKSMREWMRVMRVRKISETQYHDHSVIVALIQDTGLYVGIARGEEGYSVTIPYGDERDALEAAKKLIEGTGEKNPLAHPGGNP